MKKTIAILLTFTTILTSATALFLTNRTTTETNATNRVNVSENNINIFYQTNGGQTTDYETTNYTQGTQQTYYKHDIKIKNIESNSYIYAQMYNYSETILSNSTSGQIKASWYFAIEITPYYTINANSLNYWIVLDTETFQELGNNYLCTTEFYTTTDIKTTNNEYISSLIDTDAFNTTTTIQNQYNSLKNNIQNKTIRYNTPIDDLNLTELKYLDIGGIPITKNQTTFLLGLVNLTTEAVQYGTDKSDLYWKMSSFNIEGTLPTQPTTIEVVDIGSLMFQVLSMPFAFISQAFNITLFNGTPYQINISNILLGIISVSLLLWILKLILGKADLGSWISDQKNNKKENKNNKDKE